LNERKRKVNNIVDGDNEFLKQVLKITPRTFNEFWPK
jgi:hypothetical protein